MLEVRWHTVEHFACSWFGFAHRGGVSFIFICLSTVFCTRGLCVNHFPLSDVCLFHTVGGVPNSLHTWAVSFNDVVHTFAKQSTCKYLFSSDIIIHVCVWMYLSMQALIDHLLYSRMHITCTHI